MVNRGPSIGCQTCRERRVGCDRTRPSCKRCIKRGHACPGYRDAGGIVFKDESEEVFARHHRRAILRSTALPAQLRSDPRDASTAFFFRQCVLPTRYDWPLGNEYFEHLLPLYNSAAPSSPFAMAVSVMALKVATSHHDQEHMQTLYTEAELTAVRAIKTALSDPWERSRDEILLAILCLDFAQQLVRRDAAQQRDRPHLRGALALVRYRGPAGFNSTISQSLYVATRSHVLLHCLWSPDESEDQGLVLTLPEIQPPYESSASVIHRILQQVLCLERQVLAREPQTTSSWPAECDATTYASRAQALCSRLQRWREGVVWAPMFPLSPVGFETADDASTIQQAFIFGQYFCTLILALKLLFAEIKLSASEDTLSKERKLHAILSRVQGLVETLCNSVSPILDRGRHLARPMEDSFHPSEAKPELMNGLIGGGLAQVSRTHMICIQTWVWAILTETIPGAEDFGVEASTMAHLGTMYESVTSEPTGLSTTEAYRT